VVHQELGGEKLSFHQFHYSTRVKCFYFFDPVNAVVIPKPIYTQPAK